MSIVQGCNIPDDLYYNVDSNVWARVLANGNIQVGMTAYACSLSGAIVSYLPRKPGKEVKRDKSCATVESGKWVGPVKAPAGGEIIAVNEQLFANPGLINQDPYVQGWLIELQPYDWSGESHLLLTGPDALDAYAAKMDADGFGGC